MVLEALGQPGTAGTRVDAKVGDGLLFVELMHAVYPHLAGERNTAAFMRDILERLSSTPEELWFTTRGGAPGEDKRDSTLRKWYTRGVPQNLARRLLNNPTRETFIDSLDYVNDIETESADEVKAALAASVEPFTDADVDCGNVGEVLFDLIQKSLEFIVNPELEIDRKIQQAISFSNRAKGKYGSRLLEECKYTCSKPGCGTHLQPAISNQIAAPNFGLVKITGASSDYPNLIALCPGCFHNYSLGHRKTDSTELSNVKQLQMRSAESRQVLSTVDIEHGISKVVENLGNAKFKDFEQLTYEPVAVRKKIDEQREYFIYDEVMSHVTRYYSFIHKQMQEEAQLQTFDDDLLRAQVKAMSRKLVDRGYSAERIHNDLTERLSQITKQNRRYCAFVVSYFVQSCEVLDATT